MANEAQQTVANLLETWGMSFSARLIGETKRDDWVCDEWRVSIGSFETKYFTGTGLRKMKKGATPTTARKGCVAYAEWEKRNIVAVAPCAADVIYSFLSDAEACDKSFSDWCETFGYSNDSIKALNTYRACEEIGRSLRKVFSTKQVAELREVLSDY
jgi:hypothetical protein